MAPAATLEAECCYEQISHIKGGSGNIESEEAFEEKCKMWCKLIRLNVSKKLFGFVQFIDGEDTVQYGSGWQRKVCEQLGVLEGREAELFWYRRKHGGMAETVKAIITRRSCVTRAMKKKFHGK